MQRLRTFVFPLFVTLSSLAVTGQGLVDGFFAPRGTGAATLSYTRSSFDAFYVGAELVEGVPAHEEISQDIYNLYLKYGLTDDLTLIFNAPYIAARGNGAADPINGETSVSGFQDISLVAKYRPLSIPLRDSRFDVVTALGVSVPTGYEANGILSNGSGALTTDFNLGGQLTTSSGLFVTGLAGYSLRGTADNNLGTGSGAEFDVPDAFTLLGKVGYAGGKIYVEAFVYNQTSTDGVDIMGEGFTGNFPETEVNFTTVGATLYVPVSNTLGLSAGYGTVVDGRNVGDASYVNTGLTVNF